MRGTRAGRGSLGAGADRTSRATRRLSADRREPGHGARRPPSSRSSAPAGARGCRRVEPLLAAAGLLLWAATLRAQATPRPVAPPAAAAADSARRARQVVEGIVRDTAGAPIAGARVHLGDDDGVVPPDTVVTDRDGRFRLATRRLGTQPLLVRAIGYAALAQAVTVRSSERASLVLTLERLQRLTPVVVRASRRRDRVLAGIAERQRVGMGFFRDSADFQRFAGETTLRALYPWKGLHFLGVCGSGLAVARDIRGRPVSVVLNDMPDVARLVLDCRIDPAEIAVAEYYMERHEVPNQVSWELGSTASLDDPGEARLRAPGSLGATSGAPGGPPTGGVLVVYTRAYLADPERRAARTLVAQLRERAAARAAAAAPSAHDSVLAHAGSAPVLQGLVHDSLLGDGDGAPLAGARVVALPLDASASGGGDARETISDPRGRFAFDGLPPGRWRVQVTEAGLDSAGLYDGVLGEVTVAAGITPPRLTLATPSRATLVARLCGGGAVDVPGRVAMPRRTVLLWGGVHDEATDAPLAGAVVRVAWLSVGADGRPAEVGAEVPTDATGRWALCLTGASGELDDFTVRAVASGTRGAGAATGAATGAVTLGAGARGVARLDLTVAAEPVAAPRP